jgi:flagellar motor switch/type III secretory pathway protein FliN
MNGLATALAAEVPAGSLESPKAPQPPKLEAFGKSWFATPVELSLAEFGIAGELTPVGAWLGEAQSRILRLDGSFSGGSFKADFALILSDDFVQYLLSSLPDPVHLDDATTDDQALLFEHLLTRLLDRFETATGHAITLDGGELTVFGAAQPQAFAALNCERGALPIALASDSQPFWDTLTALNAHRVADKIPRQVQIAVGPVVVSREEAAALGGDDVIVLDDARGRELSGHLLVDGQPVFSLRVFPDKAVLLEPSRNVEPGFDAGEALRFVLGTLAMTDGEIAQMETGGELAYGRAGPVEILRNGHRAGTGTVVLQEGVFGIKILGMNEA